MSSSDEFDHCLLLVLAVGWPLAGWWEGRAHQSRAMWCAGAAPPCWGFKKKKKKNISSTSVLFYIIKILLWLVISSRTTRRRNGADLWPWSWWDSCYDGEFSILASSFFLLALLRGEKNTRVQRAAFFLPPPPDVNMASWLFFLLLKKNLLHLYMQICLSDIRMSLNRHNYVFMWHTYVTRHIVYVYTRHTYVTRHIAHGLHTLICHYDT